MWCWDRVNNIHILKDPWYLFIYFIHGVSESSWIGLFQPNLTSTFTSAYHLGTISGPRVGIALFKQPQLVLKTNKQTKTKKQQWW